MRQRGFQTIVYCRRYPYSRSFPLLRDTFFSVSHVSSRLSCFLISRKGGRGNLGVEVGNCVHNGQLSKASGHLLQVLFSRPFFANFEYYYMKLICSSLL